MNTSGPSGITRRSVSEAIETVSASSHGTPSSPSVTGATYRCTASTSPAFHAAACKARPLRGQATSICRSPSRANASDSAPLLIGSNSAPARSRLLARPALFVDALGRGDDYYRSCARASRTPAPKAESAAAGRTAPASGAPAVHFAHRQQRIVDKHGPRPDAQSHRPRRARHGRAEANPRS